jgi:hypothetical protein
MSVLGGTSIRGNENAMTSKAFKGGDMTTRGNENTMTSKAFKGGDNLNFVTPMGKLSWEGIVWRVG